jgi:hypothetical protein
MRTEGIGTRYRELEQVKKEQNEGLDSSLNCPTAGFAFSGGGRGIWFRSTEKSAPRTTIA